MVPVRKSKMALNYAINRDTNHIFLIRASLYSPQVTLNYGSKICTLHIDQSEHTFTLRTMSLEPVLKVSKNFKQKKFERDWRWTGKLRTRRPAKTINWTSHAFLCQDCDSRDPLHLSARVKSGNEVKITLMWSISCLRTQQVCKLQLTDIHKLHYSTFYSWDMWHRVQNFARYRLPTNPHFATSHVITTPSAIPPDGASLTI